MLIRFLSRLAARRRIFPAEAAAAASSMGSFFQAANSSSSKSSMVLSGSAMGKGGDLVSFHASFPPPRQTIIPGLVALATLATCVANCYLKDDEAPKHAPEEAPEKATKEAPCGETVDNRDQAVRWDKWEEFYNSEGDLPDYVNWLEAGAVTPVMDQDGTESCDQCAAVAAVEGIHQIKTGKLVSLSVQQLIDCTGFGCKGGSRTPATFRYMARMGCITKEDYPLTGYCGSCDGSDPKLHCGKCQDENFPVAVRIDGYYYSQATDENLKRAVAMQPVFVDIYCNETFKSFRGGRTLELSDCDVGEVPDVNQLHSVLVVAYGEDADGKYWLIKNSWSEKWGDKGFAKLRRGVANSSGWGVAGITSVEGRRVFYLPVID